MRVNRDLSREPHWAVYLLDEPITIAGDDRWVEPGGGLPFVAMSGRNVIQMICAHEGRPFSAMT